MKKNTQVKQLAETVNSTPALRVILSPVAHVHLRWMIERTSDELSAYGLIDSVGGGVIRISDFILAAHESSAAFVENDMAWFADLQMRLHVERGIEPWQLACWLHTHPVGCNGPSGTDDQTMDANFADYPFALMMIQPHGRGAETFARAYVNTRLGRIHVKCRVDVDWLAWSTSVGPETIDQWEQEFQERVSARSETWSEIISRPRGWDDMSSGYDYFSDDVEGVENESIEYDDFLNCCDLYGIDPTDRAECMDVLGVFFDNGGKKRWWLDK